MKEKKRIIKTKTEQAPRLISLGIPFVQTLTKSHDKIELKNKIYIRQSNHLEPATLQLIRKVKEHNKNKKPLEQTYKNKDIDFIKFYIEPEHEIFTDVCEIDINGAYWNIAHKLGYLSKELFELGNNTTYNKEMEKLKEKYKNPAHAPIKEQQRVAKLHIPKLGRLAALGSLATVKNRYVFDGKKLERTSLTNKKTRNFYFHICKTLDNIIKGCAELCGPENFTHYWVDAVFCKTAIKEQVYKYFLDNELKVKTKELTNIQLNNNGVFWYAAATDYKGDIKTYIMPKDEFSYITKLGALALKIEKAGALAEIKELNNVINNFEL